MPFNLTDDHKNIALYIAKCVTGFAVLALFGEAANIPDISWVVISMLLVLSPDSKEVIPLTVIRVKANLIASFMTVICLVLFPNITLAICIALTATIIGCYIFKLMTGSRPALAAVIIIALHPFGTHLWSTAAERIAAVVAGCAVGLMLTFAFHRTIPGKHHLFGGLNE